MPGRVREKFLSDGARASSIGRLTPAVNFIASEAALNIQTMDGGAGAVEEWIPLLFFFFFSSLSGRPARRRRPLKWIAIMKFQNTRRTEISMALIEIYRL